MSKCVILAGGRGTRLSEETHSIPKPSLLVGDKPLIHHIINSYIGYDVREFILAVGYKAHILIGYFVGLPDVDVIKSQSQVDIFSTDWKISLVDTGIEPMTGGRLRRLRHLLDEPFYFTYGDGLSNVDVTLSMKTLIKNNSISTITSVRPMPRFGSVVADVEGRVIEFGEKEENLKGWINGGFAALSPEIFSYISDDECNLEKDVFPILCNQGKLWTVFHEDFWKCCDTKRDLDELNEIYNAQGEIWLR